MKIEFGSSSIWYHGSNLELDILRKESTITQWRMLAEAFSHKPSKLEYEDDGSILHNGQEPGYLYVIEESIEIDIDIYRHPRSTMDENAEFLTKRPLKLKLLCKLAPPR